MSSSNHRARSRPSERSILTALIAAALAAGCSSGKSASTGPPPPSGTVTSIVIRPEYPMVPPGETQQFTATAYYSEGGSANVTATVEWAALDAGALTIDNLVNKGLAARLTDGSYRITATLGSLTATLRASPWAADLATSLHFDGDAGGTGTGAAIGHLASDATSVYWAGFDQSLGASGGSIGKVAKAGGTAVTLASGLGGINALACDGAHVYWTEFELGGGDGAVKRVPVAGGAVEVLASGTPAGSTFDVFFPGGIAVDGTHVYWGEWVGGGAIRRVPKSGGTVEDLGRGQGFGPIALCLDGGYVLGVNNNGGTGIAARLPIAGGTLETLASGIANAADVASDGAALYLPELVGPNGRVVRVSLTGAGTQALATALDNPRSVSLQEGFVYYTGATGSGDTRTIGAWKVPASGGTPTLVLNRTSTTVGFDPYSLIADDTRIYFVDSGGSTSGQGRVLSAPRE